MPCYKGGSGSTAGRKWRHGPLWSAGVQWCGATCEGEDSLRYFGSSLSHQVVRRVSFLLFLVALLIGEGKFP